MDDDDYECRELSALDIEWVLDIVEETGGKPFVIGVYPSGSEKIAEQPDVFSLLLSSEGAVLMRSRPEDADL